MRVQKPSSQSNVKAVTPADLFPGTRCQMDCICSLFSFAKLAAATPSQGAASANASAAKEGDIWSEAEVATREEDAEVFKPDGRSRPQYVL